MTSDSLNSSQNSRFPPFPYGIISQKNCLCSNSSLPVLSWTLSRKLFLSFHQNYIKVTGEFHVAKSKAYFSVLILFYSPAGFNTVSSSLFLEALYLVSAHRTLLIFFLPQCPLCLSLVPSYLIDFIMLDCLKAQSPDLSSAYTRPLSFGDLFLSIHFSFLHTDAS